MKNLFFLVIVSLSLLNSNCSSGQSQNKTEAKTMNTKQKYPDPPVVEEKTVYPVQYTDAQWKERLTPEQYYILRKEGTEPAFSGKYDHFYEKGTYYSAASLQPVFSSETKFNSGTGWPSYYAPVAKANVSEETDRSYGIVRTEVKCHRCGSHLGHVFDDGPRPTGLRYCINSVSLKFEKAK